MNVQASHLKPLVSILIVNYNGRKFLGPCLDSISKYVSVPHEVIVVDNASQDDSVEFIRKNYPSVVLIAGSENLGFAKGNNLAAQKARGEYLLLLNNDTEMKSDVAPLLDLITKDSSIGVVGGKLFYADGRPQESMGYDTHFFNLLFSWLPLARRFPDWRLVRRSVRLSSRRYQEKQADADWVSGAFLLTKRMLWNELGGMDSNYFMYMEDTDYCWRVRQKKQRVVYSSLCHILHYEGAGKAWIGEKAVQDSVRSYLTYLRKRNGTIVVGLFRILLSIIFSIRSVAHLIVGFVSQKEIQCEQARAYGRRVCELMGFKNS